MGLLDSAINNFLFKNVSAGTAERNADDSSTVRNSPPFNDQVSGVNAVREQLRDLSHKILPSLQPVLRTRNWGKILNRRNQAVNCESAMRCLSFLM